MNRPVRHMMWDLIVSVPDHCLYFYFVGNVQKSPIASHLMGLDPSLGFCCQGPALTGITEDR